jgi:hypothetical protein
MDHIFGWDIGGAHLKLSRLTCGGSGAAIFKTWIRPFAIWQAPERLPAQLTALLDEAAAGLDRPPVEHGVTMTAELADVFEPRADGVRAILRAGAAALGAARWRVLTIEGALVSPERADAAPLSVAAANWAASARLAARLRSDAILADVGSTTTDLIPIAAGRPAPRGRTDTERLLSGELVYTGLLRTPPASLAATVPLPAGECGIAPEHFALMADAYRVLGRISEEEYTVPTADGRSKEVDACRARLARLVCADAAELGRIAIDAIAARLEGLQVERIAAGLRQVLAAGRFAGRPTVVTAGAGTFLAAAAAAHAGLQATRLSALLPGVGGDRWDAAAPSAAIALLLAGEAGLLDLPSGERGS